MPASRIFSGVSKSGSPTDRLMISRPGRFQFGREGGDAHGRGRLDARETVGKKGHDRKSPGEVESGNLVIPDSPLL